MPSRLNVETETLDRAVTENFTQQPFERGFGTTIGNSIRRALLSSIEGAAITAVKIEGVEHEFSSIKGVVEDATDIILNLKQVPFTLHGGGVKTLSISKKGAGVVTSADIEADGDVEVLDADIHIATISAGGSLNIEMRLKQGRGYVSAEFNNDEDLSVGYIPIDSVHTPIKKVNYNVEKTRQGSNTEFDKLTHRGLDRRLGQTRRFDRPRRKIGQRSHVDLHQFRRGRRRIQIRGYCPSAADAERPARQIG